jgi:hypothetical protein
MVRKKEVTVVLLLLVILMSTVVFADGEATKALKDAKKEAQMGIVNAGVESISATADASVDLNKGLSDSLTQTIDDPILKGEMRLLIAFASFLFFMSLALPLIKMFTELFLNVTSLFDDLISFTGSYGL